MKRTLSSRAVLAGSKFAFGAIRTHGLQRPRLWKSPRISGPRGTSGHRPARPSQDQSGEVADGPPPRQRAFRRPPLFCFCFRLGRRRAAASPNPYPNDKRHLTVGVRGKKGSQAGGDPPDDDALARKSPNTRHPRLRPAHDATLSRPRPSQSIFPSAPHAARLV